MKILIASISTITVVAMVGTLLLMAEEYNIDSRLVIALWLLLCAALASLLRDTKEEKP